MATAALVLWSYRHAFVSETRILPPTSTISPLPRPPSGPYGRALLFDASLTGMWSNSSSQQTVCDNTPSFSNGTTGCHTCNGYHASDGLARRGKSPCGRQYAGRHAITTEADAARDGASKLLQHAAGRPRALCCRLAACRSAGAPLARPKPLPRERSRAVGVTEGSRLTRVAVPTATRPEFMTTACIIPCRTPHR
jgi:hypothetical protein